MADSIRKKLVFVDAHKLLLILRTISACLLIAASVYAFIATTAYLFKPWQETGHGRWTIVSICFVNMVQICNATIGFYGE